VRPVELRAGGAVATIDPDRGGRLASLRVDGRELLLGPPDAVDAGIGWGCYLMAPWPGRLADGRLSWRGRRIQLRRTHGRHAIHGLVASVPWEVVEAPAATKAALRVGLDRDGWPFGGEVRQSFRLEPTRLTIEASIHAEREMPAALGWHPWFQRRISLPTELDPRVAADPGPRVMVDATGTLRLRGMIPTGAVDPLTRRTDLRAGPALGRRRLDDVYVDARSPAVIRWPELELRLELDPLTPTVVVFTPPHAFCVEPQTARPNALGLPDAAAAVAGRRVLRAGESLRASIRLDWRLAADHGAARRPGASCRRHVG